MQRFEHKVAFITGGARGIGEMYGRALAREGAAIAIADTDIEAAQKTAASLSSDGARAFAVQCDVADERGVADAVESAVRALGGIDILVNNAALHLMEYNVPLTALTREKWRAMLNVNVIGIVNCVAACRPHLRMRGGVIVNIASTAGFVVNSPYGISKLAVRGLTVGLAHELATDNIRVFGIAPGLVDSPAAQAGVPQARREEIIQRQQLIKRQGRMSDLIGAMLFLCSDESSFMTGETLLISGGYPARL